jgi:hypothetical protein
MTEFTIFLRRDLVQVHQRPEHGIPLFQYSYGMQEKRKEFKIDVENFLPLKMVVHLGN